MEEMLEDTFDSVEDEDMEEEAQEEVDKILFEVTQGFYYTEIISLCLILYYFHIVSNMFKICDFNFLSSGALGQAGSVATSELPVSTSQFLSKLPLQLQCLVHSVPSKNITEFLPIMHCGHQFSFNNSNIFKLHFSTLSG